MRTFRRCRRFASAPVPAAVDAGLTLVEVIVATSLIGVVMAASTSFFVSVVTVTNLSGGQQTAVQLATEGIEAVRAVPVTDLRVAVDNPNGRWTPPSPADSPPASNDSEQPISDGVRFLRTWSVTPCWQPPVGGSCGSEAAGYLPFLRVAVTVTWPVFAP
jgi:prepilin-type N-terminal cleavage/methylation domain-containing protein